MNRTAALLLALTTLLAHGLLIHQDGTGAFAPPYDSAHVAFRFARNLVQEGTLDWNPATGEVGHYPSPLWIVLCAVAERLYLPVTTFAQTLGVLCTLATVVCVAQFTRDRLAGVIAPLLLVVNGGIAAAGTGGTEVALLTLLVTASFLARERRAPLVLASCLVLLVLTRPEGALAVACFAGFELLRRMRSRSTLLRAFVPAGLVFAVLVGLRWERTGTPFSPGLFAGEPRLGARYLASFFLGAGSPLLVVVPLAILLRGRLVGRARRALLFALAWTLWVGWTGGDDLPFWNAMVPALPLLFLAVQDGATIALDTRRPAVHLLTLAMLAAGLSASVLASKLPGRIGPLPGLPTAESWSRSDPVLAAAHGQFPGRRGLLRRLNETQRLRSVGIFLRDRLQAHSVVLTPWPGAVGYLSGHTVLDMLGRVTPSPASAPPNPWHGTPRGAVVEDLERLPDYVVAWIDPLEPLPDRAGLIDHWLRTFDREGPTQARAAELDRALEPYEVVSVAVPETSLDPARLSEHPVALLRRRDLRLTPLVRIRREGDRFRVTVRHRGHPQLVDLEVTVEDRDGVTWYLAPTGELRREHPVRARKRLHLFPTGSREVDLLAGTLPEGVQGARVRARLRNPRASGPWSSAASAEAGPPR